MRPYAASSSRHLKAWPRFQTGSAMRAPHLCLCHPSRKCRCRCRSQETAEREGREAWSARSAGLGWEGTGYALGAGAEGLGAWGRWSGQPGEGVRLEEVVSRLVGWPVATLIEGTLQKHF